MVRELERLSPFAASPTAHAEEWPPGEALALVQITPYCYNRIIFIKITITFIYLEDRGIQFCLPIIWMLGIELRSPG